MHKIKRGDKTINAKTEINKSNNLFKKKFTCYNIYVGQ